MEKMRKHRREWSKEKSFPKTERDSIAAMPVRKNMAKYPQRRSVSDENLRQNSDVSSRTIPRSRMKEVDKESTNSENQNKTPYGDAFSCNCAPDFYNAVLGPTADEVILRGLTAIMSIFQKFTTCDTVDDQSEESASIQSSYKSASELVVDMMEAMGVPPEMAQAIVQTSFESIKEKKPSVANKLMQTSPPMMVSRILQTLGLSPETISQIVQTSFVESIPKEPSLRSAIIQTLTPQLKVGMAQTDPAHMTSVDIQTSEMEIPPPPPPPEPEPKEEPPPPPAECVCEDAAVCVCEHPKPNVCVCCQCIIPEDEISELVDTRSYSVSERIREENEKMLRVESPVKMRICKCLEYSTVPLCRRRRNSYELTEESRNKCSCHSRHRRLKHSYAKGDNGFAAPGISCCCNSNHKNRN